MCGAEVYGPKFVGVHGSRPSDSAVTGVGGDGGADHGAPAKSKNSSKSGCAASRGVRWAKGPMNRFSTNLITAV